MTTIILLTVLYLTVIINQIIFRRSLEKRLHDMDEAIFRTMVEVHNDKVMSNHPESETSQE